MSKTQYDQLAAPFADDQVQFRVFQKSQDGESGMLTPYIKKDAVIQRLDEVLKENWDCNYEISPNAQLPGVIAKLTLTIAGRIVTRCGADYVANENKTGNFSLSSSATKAFLHAAEMFGIGAYLYGLKSSWVELNERGYPVAPVTLDMCSKTYEQKTTSKQGDSRPAPKAAPSAPQSKDGTLDLSTFKWTMGKHKGKLLNDIDKSYWDWAFRDAKMDACNPASPKFVPDLYIAAKHAYLSHLETSDFTIEAGTVVSMVGGEDELVALRNYADSVSAPWASVMDSLTEFGVSFDPETGIEPYPIELVPSIRDFIDKNKGA